MLSQDNLFPVCTKKNNCHPEMYLRGWLPSRQHAHATWAYTPNRL